MHSIKNNTIFAASNGKDSNMKTLKVREILKMLGAEGWILIKTRGDHRQFKHPTKTGKVTVAGKPNDDVDGLVLQSIFKQAGWK